MIMACPSATAITLRYGYCRKLGILGQINERRPLMASPGKWRADIPQHCDTLPSGIGVQ
jgi:hypothetical protein